ncbi:hypothetical protein BGZ73_008013 [Actinomortierella ambigua]|nr:hypothetical protein BGZ73_008013 [Actinomortierella ambigua]
MCVCQIPVPQIKFHLAEICVKYRADDQALRFLDDLLRSTNSGFFGLDLVRAYQLLRLTDVSDAWIALACDHETSIRISATSLNELVPHAEKRHQPILARALVDHVVARSSAVQLDRQIMTSWTLSLIADSLVINNTRSEDPVVYFEEHERPSSQCDEAISSMARTLYTHPEAMMASGLEQIALALALHALYLLFTADSQLPDPQSSAILDWALLIDERTKQLQDDDLDVVLRAFKTLPNLLILVQVLDATELYSLAMTLLDRMIDDFAQLKRATNALYADSFKSNPITVRALESMIDDIEQRRLAAAAASGWYYDYDAGHWVQQEEEKDSVRSLTVDDGNTTDQLVTILLDQAATFDTVHNTE